MQRASAPSRALIDVSPRLSPATPVWPGDQPLAVRWTERLAAGQASNLSAITLTPHLGAHADAPLHLFDGGAAMSDVDLRRFIGPATVADLAGASAVSPRDLEPLDLGGVERLLLRTRAAPGPAAFPHHFAHLTLEAADLLVASGLLLVGIDTPSVDAAGAAALPVHRRLLAAGVAILEGLELGAVAAGRYELIALPLRLEGVEASPVRAVLRALD